MNELNQRKIYLSQMNAQHKALNRHYPHNLIRTSKYTILSFIPLNLLNQFKKAANVYFLIITYLQTIKAISISDGKPIMALPLTFVVIVSMCKDAFEDYKRHVNDATENEGKKTQVYRNGNFEEIMWKDLHVGEIIRVDDENFVPADIVILKSSDAKGTCYVETKNLDGETNLKIKQAHKDLQ